MGIENERQELNLQKSKCSMDNLKKTLISLSHRLVAHGVNKFTQAAPFPHAVFDEAIDQEIVNDIHDQFWTLPSDYWQKNNDAGIEVKWRSNWKSEFDIPEPAREVVRYFNSASFLRGLSALTGIDKLIPDPYYTGGGFNLIQRGGMLDVHVDGNWHDAMGVHRRLNLILYLNSSWRREWGGELHFYDENAEQKVTSIDPIGNRLVVFETTDYSYHGHPEPLESPEGIGRTSIILYYYTAAPRPVSQISENRPHSALWKSKNWLDKRGKAYRE